MRHIDELKHLASALSVVHHIPGRVRLKAKPEAIAHLTLANIGLSPTAKLSLDSLPGIHAVRVNLAALSCVIEYDPQAIAPSAWTDILTHSETSEAEALLDILEIAYASAKGA